MGALVGQVVGLDVDVAGQLAMAKDVLDAAAHLSAKRDCTNIANMFLFPHINIPILCFFQPCFIWPSCFLAATGQRLYTKDCVCARPWDSCCVDKRAEHDREKSFEQHLGWESGAALAAKVKGTKFFLPLVARAQELSPSPTGSRATRLAAPRDSPSCMRAFCKSGSHAAVCGRCSEQRWRRTHPEAVFTRAGEKTQF